MFFDNNTLSGLLNSIQMVLIIVSALLHVVFASAVAHDAGRLAKINRTTYLVSGVNWAFATLIGGVFVAGLYWLMHYSTLARGQG